MELKQKYDEIKQEHAQFKQQLEKIEQQRLEQEAIEQSEEKELESNSHQQAFGDFWIQFDGPYPPCPVVKSTIESWKFFHVFTDSPAAHKLLIPHSTFLKLINYFHSNKIQSFKMQDCVWILVRKEAYELQDNVVWSLSAHYSQMILRLTLSGFNFSL